MTDWNGFKGAAKRLDDIDLPRIGHRIGVGEDELHAFMDVEAAGSGFDRAGRPKMLFEPHVFYRNLTGDKRDRAMREGLAYRKWGEKPYPADSYDRLLRAFAIDETAALRSASWGLTQILGENAAMVGFASSQEMVRAFMDDEEHHLEAAVEYLIATNLADDLRAHKWAALARGYNGPGYRKNAYDTKMAVAFAKWRKIPDTPWTPEEGEAVFAPIRSKMVSRGMRGSDVRALQERLIAADHYQGAVDGIFGPMTEAAVRAFQRTAEILVDGYAGPQTLGALDAALSPEKEAAMPAEQKPAPIGHNGGPGMTPDLTPVESTNKANKGSAGAFGGAGVGGAVVYLWSKTASFPAEWSSDPQAMIAVTLIVTALTAGASAWWAAYKARDYRLMPKNAN